MNEQDIEVLYRSMQQKLRDVPTQLHRYLYEQIDWRDRLIGIKGPRGVGKSTLILQHIKQSFKDRSQVMYITLDDLWFASHDLPETVDYLYSHGIRWLFIDEIHYFKRWQTLLKNLYDTYRQLHIVFTGSSMLQIKQGEGDLSRRPVIYSMKGLSFREFLEFENVYTMQPLAWTDLLEQHESIAEKITENVQVLPLFEKYLKYGYYPFYKEVYRGYWERVRSTANMVLEVDYPKVNDVSQETILKMKKMLMVLASRIPQTPKMAELYRELDTDRNQGLKMLYALEDGGLLALLSQKVKDLKHLGSPDKIYLDNPTLMYALTPRPDIGTIRETFFYNQMRVGHTLTYPYDNKGDFLVDNRFFVEVGGKNKSFEQIKDIADGYLAVDDTEIGHGHRIPLWMYGLLY